MSKKSPAHVYFSTTQINHTNSNGDRQLWELPVVTIEQPGVGRSAITLDSLPYDLYNQEHVADIDLNKIVDYLQNDDHSPWVVRHGKSFDVVHMPDVDVDTLTNRVYPPDEFTPAPEYDEPLYVQPTILQGAGKKKNDVLGFLITQNSEDSNVISKFHTFVPTVKLSSGQNDKTMTADDKQTARAFKEFVKNEEQALGMLMQKCPELRNFVEYQALKKNEDLLVHFNDKPMSIEQIELGITYLDSRIRQEQHNRINKAASQKIETPTP